MMTRDEVSDGVQAYLSLIATLNAIRHAVLLIDEPEVFLYPALVRQFGAYATRLAEEHGMNLIFGTHSPDLLLGCLQQSDRISIIRLGYNYEYGEVFTVDPTKLKGFLSRPLVRGANALSALFAHGAIVTEDDNDRTVYEMMLQKASLQGFERETVQVLNARGKDTLADIVGPLRAFGVPAAAVTDIDVLDNRHTWGRVLEASGVPGNVRKGLVLQRHLVWDGIKKIGEELIKRKGVERLDGELRRDVDAIVDQVKAYGIFIVPVGSLEGWLKGVPRLRNKTDWATQAIEHLHSMSTVPSDAEWARFVNDISAWIRNRSRKGMRTS